MIPDKSYLRLPGGLKILAEIKGGPDSLTESLIIVLTILYEESKRDVTTIPDVSEF